jgi:hypothetical protein
MATRSKIAPVIFLSKAMGGVCLIIVIDRLLYVRKLPLGNLGSMTAVGRGPTVIL